jgi:hypothetical protein
MSIEDIRKRRAAIDGAPWKYENLGQTVFGHSPGGCNKTPSDYMVANIRGWGHLQYMGETRGDAKAQAMQDANGEFIGRAPEDVDYLLDVIVRTRGLLMSASRYVQGYLENQNNHPQARDGARSLLMDIQSVLEA